MSHIHVQTLSQNLSNSLNCTDHLRVLAFLFFLPLFCSGVIVYLGSCRMVYTVDLGDSNFFSIGLPSLAFLPPLPFVYLHSNLLTWNHLFSGLRQTVHRWDIVVPIHTLLLLTCYFGVIYLGPLDGGLLPALVAHSLHWVSLPS